MLFKPAGISQYLFFKLFLRAKFYFMSRNYSCWIKSMNEFKIIATLYFFAIPLI